MNPVGCGPPESVGKSRGHRNWIKKIEIAETTYYCDDKLHAKQAQTDRTGHGRQTWLVI